MSTKQQTLDVEKERIEQEMDQLLTQVRTMLEQLGKLVAQLRVVNRRHAK